MDKIVLASSHSVLTIQLLILSERQDKFVLEGTLRNSIPKAFISSQRELVRRAILRGELESATSACIQFDLRAHRLEKCRHVDC